MCVYVAYVCEMSVFRKGLVRDLVITGWLRLYHRFIFLDDRIDISPYPDSILAQGGEYDLYLIVSTCDMIYRECAINISGY